TLGSSKRIVVFQAPASVSLFPVSSFAVLGEAPDALNAAQRSALKRKKFHPIRSAKPVGIMAALLSRLCTGRARLRWPAIRRDRVYREYPKRFRAPRPPEVFRGV